MNFEGFFSDVAYNTTYLPCMHAGPLPSYLLHVCIVPTYIHRLFAPQPRDRQPGIDDPRAACIATPLRDRKPKSRYALQVYVGNRIE